MAGRCRSWRPPDCRQHRPIQVFGQGGDDIITLSESQGALRRTLFGGNGNDTITGGSGADMLFGQTATTRCSARADSISCSAAAATTR